MTQPLALIFYQKLLPGSQLVNRLQDLGYRVQACGSDSQLLECARTEGPMLILIDADSEGDTCALIRQLRSDSATTHLPVVAFSSTPDLLPLTQEAGATVVASETAILAHLSHVLEQALRVD